MNATVIPIKQLDRGQKRCRDCAHCIPGIESVFDKCGFSIKENYSTGEIGHFHCEAERIGGCGPTAIHFTPTPNYEAMRSVRRLQNMREIVGAITHHNPSASDAQEILDALTESLNLKYGNNAIDALGVARELREALEEVYNRGG